MKRLTLDPTAGLFPYLYVSFDTFIRLFWYCTPYSRPMQVSLHICMSLFLHLWVSFELTRLTLDPTAGLFPYLFVSFDTFIGLFWHDMTHSRPHCRSLSTSISLFWYNYRSYLKWHASPSTPVQVSLHIDMSLLIHLQVLFDTTHPWSRVTDDFANKTPYLGAQCGSLFMFVCLFLYPSVFLIDVFLSFHRFTSFFWREPHSRPQCRSLCMSVSLLWIES